MLSLETTLENARKSMRIEETVKKEPVEKCVPKPTVLTRSRSKKQSIQPKQIAEPVANKTEWMSECVYSQL